MFDWNGARYHARFTNDHLSVAADGEMCSRGAARDGGRGGWLVVRFEGGGERYPPGQLAVATNGEVYW